MFRNSLFANDPYFSSHMAGMHQMEQSMDAMMSNLMDPFGFFGGPRQQALQYNAYNRDYDRRGERQNSRQLQELAVQQQVQQQQRQRHPMGMFDDLFGGFGMMPNMHNMLAQQMGGAQGNPNSSFYSQSTVMSYQNTGDGRPRIYQASTSEGQTNGVKEVRKSVRDSAEGVEKMTIQREMGDKSQVITKQRNANTGDLEEEKELVNLDEEEEDQFSQDFRQRMSQGPFQPPRSSHTHQHSLLGHPPGSHHAHAHHQQPRTLALEAPGRPDDRHTHAAHAAHAAHADRQRYEAERHRQSTQHMPRYGSYEGQPYRERDTL